MSGGGYNLASGSDSSVAGGRDHRATDDFTSVTGGRGNTANGDYASVHGGYSNTATGLHSSVSAGDGLTISTSNEWTASLFVETSSQASNANTTPEVYRLLAPPLTCDADTRGQIYIARPSANGSQDGVCYCGNIDGNYRVNCFTP